jgi:hypothetical protein
MIAPKRRSTMKSILLAGALLLHVSAASAQPIQYLSSSSGYMLHRNGNTAVTANWSGQAPINGFSGYGAVRMDGLCLTGRNGNQPLQWETCKSADKAQVWGYSNGRLNNELGWCADVEGNRGGAGVRVLAWRCSGASNQTWKVHRLVPAAEVLSRVSNAEMRRSIETQLKNAVPGQAMKLTQDQLRSIPRDALIGLDGATLISAGGLGFVSSGSTK